MGLILKKNNLLYTSLIFNYSAINIVTILFNDTNLDWDITSPDTGILEIITNINYLQQNKYCVNCTPMCATTTYNNSINVLTNLGLSDRIRLNCLDLSNSATNDGYLGMTCEIKFFQ